MTQTSIFEPPKHDGAACGECGRPIRPPFRSWDAGRNTVCHVCYLKFTFAGKQSLPENPARLDR